MRALAPAIVAVVAVVVSLACDGGASRGAADPRFDVLIVSDSNGVGDASWPAIVRRRLESRSPPPKVRVVNASRAGRTLAIDRGGSATAAHLGLEEWLEAALADTDGTMDLVVIALGTNDVQGRFAPGPFGTTGYWERVDGLLARVARLGPVAGVLITSPPPICAPEGSPSEVDEAEAHPDPRWMGAEGRLRALNAHLEATSARLGLGYLDLTSAFALPVCRHVAPDGVHLDARGHEEIARIVGRSIETSLGDRPGAGAPQGGAVR